MSPRTPEQNENIRVNRKKSIMKAALEVFSEDGYHLASVSRIARKAGVSKGLMYNYFHSKEALLIELMEGTMKEMMEKFPLTESDTFTKKEFIQFIEITFDMVVSDPGFWHLYFAIFIQPDVLPLLMDGMMKTAMPYMSKLTLYFKGKDYNDPIAAMRYFSAVLDGVQLHIMLDPKNFPVEKAKKLIIDQFA